MTAVVDASESKTAGSSEPGGQPRPKSCVVKSMKKLLYQLCVNCSCTYSSSWPSEYRICAHSCQSSEVLDEHLVRVF